MAGTRGFGCGAYRDIVRYHGDFRFEIKAEAFIAARQGDGVARPKKRVRAALIQQRIAPERGGHVRAARLSDECHVVHIGRTIRPLIRPWQWRSAIFLSKRQTGGSIRLKCGGASASKSRRGKLPIVERRLQSSRNAGGPERRGSRSFETTASLPSRPDLSDAEFHLKPVLMACHRSAV